MRSILLMFGMLMVSNVAYSADVRVVAAWAAGPLEARVQFADPIADRAIFKTVSYTHLRAHET